MTHDRDARPDAETIAWHPSPGSVDRSPPDAPLAGVVPARLGRYRLMRPLGSGGFGQVHLAHDEVLDRPVAVKFLASTRPVEVARLRREARVTARLSHPNIVAIYELGEHDDRPFIVMQYVPGSTLASVTLERDALVRILIQVGDALHAAHARGIVHRDIKPSNILVGEDGRGYLTDFGIAGARFVDGAAAPLEIAGTPATMSPEQARGDPTRIDARSDIYSFGATMYRLLTGRDAYRGRTAAEVIERVLSATIVFPRALDPSIPRSLEAIVLKCMDRDPGARYATMHDVVDQLRHAAAGDRIDGESGAWLRRLVGAEVATARRRDPPPESEAAEFAREIAEWDTHLYRVSSNLPRLFPALHEIVARLDAILEMRPATAWARFYRGMAYQRLGRLVEALDDMEVAIDRVADRTGALFELGRLYLEQYLRERRAALAHVSPVGARADLQAARTRLDHAVAALQEAEATGGTLRRWQHDYVIAVSALAEDDVERCVATCDAMLAEDADLEEVWKLRGDALRARGRDPIESYDRAVDVRRSYVDALVAKAETLLERAAFDAARETLDRVLELTPDCPATTMMISRSYLTEARHTEDTAAAADLLARAAAVLARLDPERSPDYDTAVLEAEIGIALAEATRTMDPTRSALAALARARRLRGCQNRVDLLEASTWLAQARLEPDEETACAYLTQVRDRRHTVSPGAIPDTPWQSVFDGAETLARERGWT